MTPTFPEKATGGDAKLRLDYTNKDYESLRQAMLDLARIKLPAWTDHSPNDLGVMLLELFAYMGDLILHYQDRIANESYLDTAVEPKSIINLLRLIGCELTPPQPTSADLTLLFNKDFKKEGPPVTIDTDTPFLTTAQATGSPIRFHYVGRPLTIKLDDLEDFKIEGDQKQYLKLKYFLPVIQVDAVIPKEIVGSSDNSPGQRFALDQTPLILDSLEVRVGEELWECQETWLNSNAGSKHYLVRRDEAGVAWLEFGDGKLGAIPPRGYNNISAFYRVGGGIKGNVPAQTITVIDGKIGDQDNTLEAVFNEKAANGGAEREDLARAVQRGPQLFRARSRAVTARDYEDYALEFGVGKVRVRAPGWNVVELYVAPVGGGYPSDTLVAELKRFFRDKQLLTTIIEVRRPAYVDVYVEGVLYVKSTYHPEPIKQRVEAAIRDYLAFDRVDFGAVLYISDLYKIIEEVEGVDGVSLKWGLTPTNLDQSVLQFDWEQIPQFHSLSKELGVVHGGRRGL